MKGDLKLLAVYEDLLEKIESVQTTPGPAGTSGKDGKDGAAGKDAPVREMLAAVAALHSELTEGLLKANEVSPSVVEVVHPPPQAYKFRVHRDGKGLIESVTAIPEDSIL